MKRALTVVWLTLAAAAWSEDISGRWKVVQADRGVHLVQLFDFKADGEKITGTLSLSCVPGKKSGCPEAPGATGVPLEDGRLKGNTLSFFVTLNPRNRSVRWVYQGEVKTSNELILRREMQGAPGIQQFTAHREP